MPVLKIHLNYFINQLAYLKPIAACQTKASSKKKSGIRGRTSTKGSRIEYASGSFANNSAASMFNFTFLKQLSELTSILTWFVTLEISWLVGLGEPLSILRLFGKSLDCKAANSSNSCQTLA